MISGGSLHHEFILALISLDQTYALRSQDFRLNQGRFVSDKLTTPPCAIRKDFVHEILELLVIT